MDRIFRKIYATDESPVLTDQLVSNPHRWHTSDVTPWRFLIHFCVVEWVVDLSLQLEMVESLEWNS